MRLFPRRSSDTGAVYSSVICLPRYFTYSKSSFDISPDCKIDSRKGCFSFFSGIDAILTNFHFFFRGREENYKLTIYSNYYTYSLQCVSDNFRKGLKQKYIIFQFNKEKRFRGLRNGVWSLPVIKDVCFHLGLVPFTVKSLAMRT